MKKIIFRHLIPTLALAGMLVVCWAFTHVYASPHPALASQAQGDAQPELVVQVKAGGDPRTFNFTLSPDDEEGTTTFSASESNPATRPLKPGKNYTLSAVEPPAGWRLAKVSCAPDKFTMDGNSVSDIKLSGGSGSTATCTFTYEPVVETTDDPETGTIIVQKVATPSDTGQEFTFRRSFGGDFILRHGEEEKFDLLAADDYTIIEDVPTGWQVSVSCSNGVTGTNSVTISLPPDQTVTCTFNNVQLGRIIVQKVATPSDTGQLFTFQRSFGGNFILGHGGTAPFGSLPHGNHTITEVVPAGWQVSVSCSNGVTGTNTVTISLTPGREVTCTFNNVQLGTIIVQKTAIPPDTGQLFTFQRSFGGEFTLGHGGTQPFDSLPSADYTIAEEVPTGWELSTSCTNGVNGNPADISLQPGETVSCTFANSAQLTAIEIRKSASATNVNPGESVQYTYEVENTSVAPLPLQNVVLTDDKCSPISGPTGALNWNETRVYTCSTTLTADTVNTASVGATDFINRSVSDTDTAFVDVRPTVSIAKTVTPLARPEPGGVFTFTLTLTNTSAERVRILELSDSYPLSQQCSALVNTNIPAGQTRQCSYTVTRSQPGAYQNTATVTVREVDKIDSRDTTNHQATASAQASFTIVDLPSSFTVTKTSDPATVPQDGGVVDFVLVAQNTSAVDAITIDSFSDSVYGDIADAANPAITATTCTPGQTLAPGEQYTCRFSAFIAGALGSQHLSTTTVAATDDDGVQLQATDEVSVLVVGALATAAKRATLFGEAEQNGVATPSDIISYTVVITNVGNGPGVFSFSDGLDSNTTLVGSVETSHGEVTPSASGFVISGIQLNPGGSATIRFQAQIKEPLPLGVTRVANQGVVTSPNAPTVVTDDPNTPAPGDPTVTTVVASPALVVAKRDTLVVDHDQDGVADPGDEVEYQVTVRNNGNQVAAGVVIEDTPDGNSTLVVGSVVVGGDAQIETGNSAGDTKVRVSRTNPLNAGATVQVTFRVRVKSPLPLGVTAISNQALVTGTNFSPVLSDDPDTAASGDPTVTPVVAQPRLTVAKSALLLVDADSDGMPSPGDTLAYNITINNNGNQAATGIVLRDRLDANTALVAGSVQRSQGDVTRGNNPGDTQIEVEVGTLAANSSAAISFQTVIANPLPAGVASVSNQATVTGTNFDPILSDDPATPAIGDPTQTTVVAAPVLSVNKRDFLYIDADDDNEAGPGDTLLYVIEIANHGNAAATNVMLRDTPDAQTRLEAGKVQLSHGTIVSGNASGDQMLVINLNTIPPKGKVNIGFRVVIGRNAIGLVVNQAEVEFINPNEANPVTVTVLSNDPDTASPGDPTLTPLGGVPAVAESLHLPFVFR